MSAVTHGIESLLLGGGFGFLTGQHGLVIDNLLQVLFSPRQTVLHHLNESYFRLPSLLRMERLSH